MNALDKLLAKTGKTRADIGSQSKIGKALRRGGVESSPELERILALPRHERFGIDVIDRALLGLRRERGLQGFREHQADALVHVYRWRGGYFPMRVGSGKTLITLLLMRVLGIDNAVLLLPAALVRKTRRDFAKYAEHWNVELPELVSYTALAHPNTCDVLDVMMPKLIIADEAHALKNPNAKCTKRVARYMEANPGTIFVALSGTLLGSSLLETPHIARWCLGDRSPIPDPSTCTRWREALDPRTPHGQRLHYGALERFGKPVPEAYHRWIVESLGVVSVSTKACDAAIEIGRWRAPQTGKAMIDEVELTGCRPDGELLTPSELASCVSQLSLRFWYRWNPLPPISWLAARREWVRFVRDAIQAGEAYVNGLFVALDSEYDVKQAFPERWQEWLAVKQTYEPVVETVWEGIDVIEAAEQYARETGAIVYNRFRAIAQRASLPVHAEQGLDARGVHIEDAKGPVWASIRSCGAGVNLQHRAHALVVTPPASAEPWEQLVGRFHREGQEADLVSVDIIRSTGYHDNVVRRVRAEAQVVHDSGREQKLVIATWK